jgi:hypothetical protein
MLGTGTITGSFWPQPAKAFFFCIINSMLIPPGWVMAKTSSWPQMTNQATLHILEPYANNN